MRGEEGYRAAEVYLVKLACSELYNAGERAAEAFYAHVPAVALG